MLPTRHGLLFSLVVLVIFLASVNYNNGLAYGLTFLLAGMALVGMLHTHRNLSGLDVNILSCEPTFAGETALFRIGVRNPEEYTRVSVWVFCGDHSQVFHLGPTADALLEVPVNTTARGFLTCPPVRLSSAYPFGLQYTWSAAINSATRGLVYPTPVGNKPLPRGLPLSNFSESGRLLDGDDFIGLREYVAGDSPKHIHWKAAASTQNLLTKMFGGEGAEELWLRWEVTTGSTEQRLSQLCRWIVDLDRSSIRYGLSMPGRDIPPDRGVQHYRRCLRILALWGLEQA